MNPREDEPDEAGEGWQPSEYRYEPSFWVRLFAAPAPESFLPLPFLLVFFLLLKCGGE